MSKTDAINQNDKIVTWMWKIFPKMHSKKIEIFLDSHSRWWIIIDKGSTTCTLLKIAKKIHQGSVDGSLMLLHPPSSTVSLALFRIYFLNFNWYYKYLSSVLSYWRSGPLSEVGMEAPLITWNFPKILYFA